MNEFSQMIELVKQELLRGDAQMEVLGAYPQQLQTAKTEAGGGGNPEGTDAAAGDAELLRGRGSAAGQAGAGLDEN